MTGRRTDDLSMEAAIGVLADSLRAELRDLQDSGVLYIPRATHQQLMARSSAAVTPSGQPSGQNQMQKPEQEEPQSALSPGAKARADGPSASTPKVKAASSEESPTRSITDTSLNAEQRLKVLCDDEIGDCTSCKLHRGRSNLVFGVGNPDARLVFVGEGPGAEEDRQGIPFVGKAGQLLTKMIQAMGYERDEVYICNVVKCRPPNNRDPEPDEVEACGRFLRAQLDIVAPDVIVGLGRFACQTLLQSKTPITRLRGQWAEVSDGAGRTIPCMPTYHPAYLLRQPERKREAWNDLKLVMKRLKDSP